MEFLMFEGMQYIIRRPEGYRESDKYPVLLFLHGAGTRGSDIRVLENNPFFKLTAQSSLKTVSKNSISSREIFVSSI